MRKYNSLKKKKLQGKNGRGIGKILNIITLRDENGDPNYYALVGVPQLFRRAIIFPLDLGDNNPIITKGGDHVFINIERYEFFKLASRYSKQRKANKKDRRSRRITADDVKIANKLIKEAMDS